MIWRVLVRRAFFVLIEVEMIDHVLDLEEQSRDCMIAFWASLNIGIVHQKKDHSRLKSPKSTN